MGLAGVEDDLELGTTELVTNAVRHARTDFAVTVRLDAVITVLVEDGDPDLPAAPRPRVRPTDVNGRGLKIIAAISSDWGVRATGTGKTVWFSVRPPVEEDRDGTDADILPLVG